MLLMFVSACAGSEPEYSEAQIASALEEMKLPWTYSEYFDAYERCVLQNGFVGEIIRDPDGSVSLDGQNAIEIGQVCTEEMTTMFPDPPRPEDRQLELTALYELQKRAAACVEEELGLEANLPSLETYVDSDGAWFMYDAAIANSPVEPPEDWEQWVSTCPQNLWHYYS